MHKKAVLVTIIIVHFIFCANCNIVPHVNKASNQSETAEIKRSQIQVAQQKESQLLTFCSYLNGAIIENMNFTVYSKDDNGNKLKFEIHPKFDSRPLDHVTIQQNSIKYEEVEFIYHDNQNDSPQILEDDSNALTQLDNVLTKDIETPVQNQFSKEVSIAMCYSSIIALFNLIFISMLVRATLTEFLSQRIINQKYISKEQKKDAQHNNKLVIPLLIVAYCSIFEVSAVTNYLINSTYDDVGSQNITVTQPTDEFQVINCTFKNCWNSGASGGALYINISNGGKCYILNTTFINCTTNTYGGAIFIYIYKGGELTIDGLCSFTDCWALWYGGGIYAQIQGVNSRLLLEDGLIFERCRTNQIGTHFKYGGGIYLNILYNSSIIINKVSCIDCESDAGGGGMFISDDSYETQKLNGTLFQRCNAGYGAGLDIYLFNNNASLQLINLTFIGCQGYYGGGLNIDTLNNTKFLLLGCQLQDCSSYDGGGIQLQISRLCLFEISNAQFKNCSGEYQGGGIYANISFGGKLIIDSCSFYLCNSGNGGGIYVIINFPSQNSFIIKDTLIQGCKALNNTNSSLRYSESGFGGGLFLGALRDYDPSSKLIDLHGLKIYNNTADKFGQSLFVAMTKVVEWCQYGFLGEYVKGNYSDRYSDERDLEGIPMDYFSYYSSNSELIEQQQQPLEHWWRILGNLKSASVIVNVSNPNGKLIFYIEGQRMIPGYLNVKIIELRDKTQEEIDQEQNQTKSNLKQNNLNFTKEHSSVSSISYRIQIINNNQIIIKKHKKQQEQYINESSNSIFVPLNSFSSPQNENKLLQINSNEIIYPPEDGSSFLIQIEGKIESEQKASFGMYNGNWLNYKQKLYGVLISNDGEVFTGLNGEVNSAVPLEIIMEDEYSFPYWGIILIAAVVVIISNIISCFCCWLCYQKGKQKKIKEQEMNQLQNHNTNIDSINGSNTQQLNNNNLQDESINHSNDHQQSDLDIGIPTLIKDKIVSEEQESTIDDGFDNHKQNKQFIIGEPLLIKDKIFSDEDIEEEQENNKQNEKDNYLRNKQNDNKQILNIGEPVLIKDKEVKEENEQEEIVKQKKNEKENKDQLIIGNPILTKDKEINKQEVNQQREFEKESQQKRKHKENKDQFDIGKPILIKDKLIREEMNMNEKQNESKDRIRQKHDMKEQDEEKKKENEKKNHQQRKQEENKANFMIGDPFLVKDRIISKNEEEIEIKKEEEQKKKINIKKEKEGNKHQNKENKKNNEDLNGK